MNDDKTAKLLLVGKECKKCEWNYASRYCGCPERSVNSKTIIMGHKIVRIAEEGICGYYR